MKIQLVFLFGFCFQLCIAQDNPFPFGKVKLQEITMSKFEKDTGAVAVVLNEFGTASIQARDEIELVFKYHVKIKILKNKGLEYANVEIPLFKKGEKQEKLESVNASSFNIENGLISESKLNVKNVFVETIDKNWDQKKFAIPNVRVGSVIEYEYELSTPYFFTFRTWPFQSEIPKVYSEYVATIPANWRYNISLRGLLQLQKNDSKILNDYFSVGSGKSDCVRYFWAMADIPAFYEEEYMTAKSNFMSAINFELLQMEYFDGRKDKITKEWKDVEQELRTSDNFGVQLKRGKDIVDEKIAAVIAQEVSPLGKAEKIFSFIRGWYQWNEKTSKYTDIGIKKAFEARKGNVGDINLSLIAALRYAGLDVEPLILSTRDNGVPIDLFPVLSEFNYVIAKLNIGDKVYLLDATEDFLPFGLLPQRCLNGKGRVLGEKESYWYEIKPTDRSKIVSMVSIVLNADGTAKGTINNTYTGYKAAQRRMEVFAHPSVDDHVKELKSEQTNFEILDCTYQNLEDITKSLSEIMTISLEDFPVNSSRSFFFNPYFSGRWTKNPFHLEERLYPVDFGVPLEETVVMTFEYPPDLRFTDLPEKVAVGLPANGGRFLYSVQVSGQKLMMNSSLVVAKPIYGAEEYPSLKELFNRVVKVQNTDLVLEKIAR